MENEIKDKKSRFKLRLSIGNKIFGGFTILIVLFAINAIIIFFTVALTAFASRVVAQSTSPTSDIEPFYGLSFSTAERDSLLNNLKDYQKAFESLHAYKLANAVPMSLVFDPLPTGFQLETQQKTIDWGLPKEVAIPSNREELAFYPVYKLAVLIKQKKITSTELTQIYLKRIKKYSDTLQCIITLLEERALQQAKQADEEIAKGKYRGLLHGIPFGVKDLFSVQGTKTTWGATPFKDQSFDYDASVIEMLRDAGAVLIAKLTTGELASGDQWFGGQTKNPWDPSQGSSGSSAGPSSATAAGCVGFGIGTETSGSILSPAARCGLAGLRPTFGRISRYGVMALSWTQDRLGPLCRYAEDCAIVMQAIAKPDGRDMSVSDIPFNWNAQLDVK